MRKPPVEVAGTTWPHEHERHEDAGQEPLLAPPGALRTHIGRVSGRDFNYDDSALPIEKLSLKDTQITEEGVRIVRTHLERFGVWKHNAIMVGRLQRIVKGDLPLTDYDVRFYTHELREFERYKARGWEHGEPNSKDEAWELWITEHTATLEEYGISDADAELYHPDADT